MPDRKKALLYLALGILGRIYVYRKALAVLSIAKTALILSFLLGDFF